MGATITSKCQRLQRGYAIMEETSLGTNDM